MGSDVTARTRLIKASLELKRLVFSSLPWGLRVAHLLHQIRFASDASVFGQSIYGLFLLYGVDGMPTRDGAHEAPEYARGSAAEDAGRGVGATEGVFQWPMNGKKLF